MMATKGAKPTEAEEMASQLTSAQRVILACATIGVHPAASRIGLGEAPATLP